MPPRSKIAMHSAAVPQLAAWLKAELKASGFAGYDELTERYNAKAKEFGIEDPVSRSTVHAFGQEYAEFVKYQEEASAWAASWMNENGLEEEAQRHNVLFQMITTLAFKVMQSQMTLEGKEIDPRELHFIGKLMKDVMSSSGMREKLLEDERKRIEAKARQAAQAEMAEALETTAKEAGLDASMLDRLRRGVLGLKA